MVVMNDRDEIYRWCLPHSFYPYLLICQMEVEPFFANIEGDAHHFGNCALCLANGYLFLYSLKNSSQLEVTSVQQKTSKGETLASSLFKKHRSLSCDAVLLEVVGFVSEATSKLDDDSPVDKNFPQLLQFRLYHSTVASVDWRL
jgi:hypothetical protein